MMYNEKMIAVIKVDGKVLSEKKGTVYLPFGAEYSITLKNLSNRLAVASISVDGESVCNNNRIIIPAKDSVELEGFLKGTKVTHKFKFIKRTKRITKHRGNKILDGLVCIDYNFEAENFYKPSIIYDNTPIYRDMIGYNKYTDIITNIEYIKRPTTYCCASSVGITTKGSTSNQRFQVGSTGTLEKTKHSIVFCLKGKVKNKKIIKPVTTKSKVKCTICDKKNKHSSNFCTHCGTALF